MKPTVLSELKRRKVVRVAGAYLLVAWVLLQVAGAIEDALELPAWFDGFVVAALAVLFPVALVVAWFFDLGRDGIRRTAPAADGATRLSRLAVALLFVVALLGGGGIAAYWYFTADTPLRGGPRLAAEPAAEDRPAPEAERERPAMFSDIDSIAVLPLDDLGPGSELAYLGVAIADELRNVLARVKGVRVASRPSSMRYGGAERPDARTISGELEVAYILDGSLQQAGDTLRVNVQLIRAADDTQVMSRRFDLPLSVDNILAIQDEVAGEVVEALGRDLGQSAQDALRFLAASATDSLAAYNAYLVARQKFIGRNRVQSPEDFEDITRKLEDATRIDPEFGHAWAALAMQYVTTISWGGDEAEFTRKARAAAERALALDARLALAHAVLGVTSNLPDGRIDRAAAIDGLTRAIDLDPLEPTLRSWRGQHWVELGFFDRGISDLEETIRLTMFNGVANFWLINAQFLLGNVDAARERLPAWSQQSERLRILDALAVAAKGDAQAVRSFLIRGTGQDPILMAVADALTLDDFDFDTGYEAVVAAAAGDEERVRLVERPLMLYVFKQYDRLPPEPPLSGRLTWWFAAHEDFLGSPVRYRYFHDLGLADYWLAREFPPRCARDDSAEGFSCR